MDYTDCVHLQADPDSVAESMPNWACHGLVQPLMPGIDTPYCGGIHIGWLGSDRIYQTLHPSSSFASFNVPILVHRCANKTSVNVSFALARRE